MMGNSLKYSFILIFLGGCASTIPEPHVPSEGHITVDEAQATVVEDIPEIVQQTPFLPPPVPEPQDLERYTVVVNDVPVKELLFALARDASLNIDVASNIEGLVTLNAVEQTLPQILQRVSRQANLRYELESNNLYISEDTPFLRTYKIDYVNLSRDSSGEISIATQIATTGTGSAGSSTGSNSGAGNNNSTTSVKSTSLNHFWETLTANISSILGENASGDAGQLNSNSVIVNQESGVISVRATSLQHQDIQAFVDQVMINAQRQVLIEATIVEVTLNDRFQAGIDWQALVGGDDYISLKQTFLPTSIGSSLFSAVIQSDNTESANFRTTLQLLKTFGDAKVLSSPKLMTINNQTAVLKVVDNIVYFTLEAETTLNQNISVTTVDSDIHTVPVGLVMSVTPQINENMAVTMNVRPTISRVTQEVDDPGLAFVIAQIKANDAQNGTTTDTTSLISKIPQIAVREMESILKVTSGQTAILGGLMQDNYQRDVNGIPGLGDIEGVGNAFKNRDFQNSKTELVIFLRPTVIYNASLNGDLSPYRNYLQNTTSTPLPVPK